MTQSLRILILEDNPVDAELVQFELQDAGFAFTAQVVMTEKDFVRELQGCTPDLILSDYDLPQYNGALALAEAQRRCPNTPFILVSGVLTEDRAIEILTQGAKDYVLKTRLQQRLIPAVRRALAEAEEHRARQQAEAELREAHRTLEERVKIRTAELEAEVATRKKLEEDRERLFAEVENRAAELDATIASMTTGMIVYDTAGKAIRMNNTAKELLPQELFFNTTVEERARGIRWETEEGQPFPLEEIPVARALRGETTRNVVIAASFPDHKLWISASAAPIRTSDGQMLGVVASFMDITERKQIEEALEDSEKRYWRLFEASKDGILILDADTGKVVDVNPFLLQLLGYSYDAVYGKYIWELGVFKDIAASREAFKVLQQKEYIRYDDLPLETLDGRAIAVEFVSNVYLVDHSKVIQCNIRDITERKRRECAVLENEERFRALVTASSEVLYRMSPDWTEMRQLHGHGFLANTENPSRTWLQEYIHPDDQSQVATAIKEAIRRKSIFELEHRVIRADGSLGWTFSRAVPLLDKNGEIVEWFGAASDVTERKRAELELKRTSDELAAANTRLKEVNAEINAERTRWQGVVEGIADEVWTCDRDGRMSLVNLPDVTAMGLESFKDRTVEEVLLDVDIMNPDGMLRPPEQAPLLRSLKGEIVRGEEIMRHRRNGRVRWRHYSSAPMRDASGVITGAVAIVRDITDLKDAEAALHRALSEAEEGRRILEAMMEHIPMGITIADAPDVNIRFVSRFGRELTGRRRDEIEGIPVDLHAERWQIFRADGVTPASNEELPLTRATQKGEVVREEEWVLKREDGKRITILCTAAPIRDSSGRITGGVIGWQDITERKRAELELKRTVDELASANKELETFSYSVSHDLRAPLRAIDGFSRMLVQGLQDRLDEEAKRRFEAIRNNVIKMNQLIEDVLTFSRLGREALTMDVIDMEKLATDVWHELQEKNPQLNIAITVAHPMACYGDDKMLRRVLTNLLANAIKFTKEKQSATIEVGGYKGEDECVYYVKDNGVGFDMRFADKLFSLFQRLHSEAEFEGTGVGLSFVKRIIERHGGRVWVEGEVNRGATFYFTLPTKQE